MLNPQARHENGKFQSLTDHLTRVSQRMKDALPPKYQALHSAGLLHDLIKAAPRWQRYLMGSGDKVNHASEAAIALRIMFGTSMKKSQIPAACYAIAAHHTEIKSRDSNWLGIGDDVMETLIEPAIAWYNEVLKPLYPDLVVDVKLGKEQWNEKEVLIRMLTAILVDCDRADASRWKGYPVPKDMPPPAPTIKPQERPTPIDWIRDKFKSAMVIEPGKSIYRLTGPTGVGKTKRIMEVCQALDAQKIIYVAPLLSILKQTADEFRGAYGDGNVLEHHSDYEPEEKEELSHKRKTERWDAPVVVTSGVQFYESLMSDRASKLRKIRALQNAVVVLDEVQTLPTDGCKAILSILEMLCQEWGTKVILVSATQPRFSFSPAFSQASEIVNHAVVKECRMAMRNREYRHVGRLDLNGVVDAVGDRSQVLIGCITRAYAQEVYFALDDALHLSSAMCHAHRDTVVDEVKRRLGNGDRCRLVATQVIESGVDISFPHALKMMSPFDSIVQFGGRVNRANEFPGAEVLLFEYGGGVEKDYQDLIDCTRQLIDQFPDPFWGDFDEVSDRFFDHKFLEYKPELGNKYQDARKEFNFPVVGEFRCITNDQETVYVPWGEGADLIAGLSRKDELSLKEWRAIGRYAVSVPSDRAQFQMRGQIPVFVGEYDDGVGVVFP